MPEERRCDLCKFEKNAPCMGKNCNSANNLKDFEPKGSLDAGDSDYSIESFTFADGQFSFVITNNSTGGFEFINATAADIMGILKK